MTAGSLVILLWAAAIWFLERGLDSWDRRLGERRAVQGLAFLAMMVGAATPLVLVYLEVVTRSTFNEWLAVAMYPSGEPRG
jgi:hypothetical protein